MLKLLHRFELRIALIAAVALLVAQWGAMAHTYSHDAAAGSGVGATHQLGAASHEICNDCLGFAPLLAGAAASGVPPPIEFHGRAPTTLNRASSLLARTLLLAFRSRAPPAIRQVL